MKKAFNVISAALFFTVISMFAVGTLLMSHSSFELDGSFSESTENFVYNNFPLFENWRSMYSALISGSGQKRIGSVYISDNGLIEITSSINDSALEDHINKINAFAEKHSKTAFYSLVAPTASGIYSAELSMIVTALDQQKLIDDIYFRLDASIQTLDAYNPLFSARDDYIFFRTDNRWTPYGAYNVYSKVIRKMGFTPVRLSEYDIEYADRNFYGDLYSKTHYSGVKPDLINIFRNKNGSFVTEYTTTKGKEVSTSSSIYYTPALDSKNKLDVFLGGSGYDRYTIKTSNFGAPKLLIVKGRFADIFVPFLTPHYSEISIVDINSLYDGTIEDKVYTEWYDQILLLTDFEEITH